jgi:hypothetical protein
MSMPITHSIRNSLVVSLVVSLGLFATSCDKAPEPAAAKKSEPVASKPAEPPVAEPTQPVVAEPEPEPEPDPAPTVAMTCDAHQAEVSTKADELAAPWSIEQHLAKNFPGKKVSWLMKEDPYQNYVVKSGAENFGRCDDTGCYLFAAPTSVIEAAVQKAITGETHDAAVLGQALGLPAKNFEGPLRMMTLDLSVTGSCVRLPVDEDPGVWKCESEADKDCFKFGGYTSGGVPEVMVINGPVAAAVVREIL